MVMMSNLYIRVLLVCDVDGPISATCIGYYYEPPEFMNSHPVLYFLCDVFGIVNSVVYK